MVNFDEAVHGNTLNKEENKKAIIKWNKDHPQDNRSALARGVGLSRETVRRLLKEIIQEESNK